MVQGASTISDETTSIPLTLFSEWKASGARLNSWIFTDDHESEEPPAVSRRAESDHEVDNGSEDDSWFVAFKYDGDADADGINNVFVRLRVEPEFESEKLSNSE